MAWRINAERLMLLAWVRAILLQLAHPLIAAGVADHSTFRGSTTAAFSRLHQTVGAMLSIAFGDHSARQQAIDGIRTVHRRIHGTLVEECGRFAAGARRVGCKATPPPRIRCNSLSSSVSRSSGCV